MQQRTRGQIEAEISNAFSAFEREHLGRGPREARTHIVGDLIVVRLKGILTPAEQLLASEGDGVEAIKSIRRRLIENSRPLIAAIVRETTGATLATMHTDLSVRTGERVFLLVLDRTLDLA